jgi:hypothetical protein
MDEAVCDQGPMHCMNQAERIMHMENCISEVKGYVRTLAEDGDLSAAKARWILQKLKEAEFGPQEQVVTEPSRPMNVGWQTWENDGIELKLWDPAKQEHLENCTSAQRNARVRELPNAANMLKEGDEVLCGGLFGWYLARITHEGGIHAENENYYFPIKWSEQQGCWVTNTQINKACFDKLKLPKSPGAQEEIVVTPPPPAEQVDITASVRTELEGVDITEHVRKVTVDRSHGTRSDQEGD